MDELLIDRRADGVVVITFNLPDRRNAMTDEMTAAWAAAMAALKEDRGARCVVVTGAGRAFCAGGDLSWIGERGDEPVSALRDRMLSFYRTWLSVAELETPTIAAINGPAVGAGLCVALACDLRYAAADATLAAPFTALGLHPGMAATHLLPRIAGVNLAREMMLAGRSLTGAEAAAEGLVNRAHPGEELLDRVLETAARVAAKAPVATRLTKVALAGGGAADVPAALRWEALAQPITMASEDMDEGLAAHRERRAPRFTGR